MIVYISFGIRQSFGLFMRPVTLDLDWGREPLSMAFAVQNIIIGLSAPLAGALADKWGAPRTVALGGALFSAGVFFMSQSTTPAMMISSGGILAGIGLGACGLPLVLAVVSRVAPPARRSLWLGVVTSAATGGQLLIVPFNQAMISGYGWVPALIMVAVLAGLIVPLAFSMSGGVTAETGRDTEINMGEALSEAFRHRSLRLLTLGYFVCGFQILFIAAHLPAYLGDKGASPEMGAMALMLIALFNMLGSWLSGWLGGKYPKKYLLSSIYLLRSISIAAFFLLPLSPVTLTLFASVIGLLWLSTVPLTTGLVAQFFGVRYMGVLYGFVYLSHQLGSFTGVWLGGLLFDLTGSYDAIWWMAIALGVVSALLHLPINDRPVERLSRAPA
ncbi:MAG: MFS transporter [Rhodospirillales bacterium]|nr:MFS transporter [Rhodospirillales bacterium]